MTPPKKRPKVRYVARRDGGDPEGWFVFLLSRHAQIAEETCHCAAALRAGSKIAERRARRIAAALNWHEAHKRGEL